MFQDSLQLFPWASRCVKVTGRATCRRAFRKQTAIRRRPQALSEFQRLCTAAHLHVDGEKEMAGSVEPQNNFIMHLIFQFRTSIRI